MIELSASEARLAGNVRAKPRPFLSRLMPRTVRGTLIFILLAMLIPLLVGEAAVYYARYQERRAQELEANLEVARGGAAAFSTFIRDVVNTEFAIGQTLSGLNQPSPAQMNGILAANLRSYPLLRNLNWLTPEGKAVASSRADVIGLDYADRDYVQAVRAGEEWAISDLMPARVDGMPIFTISRGIRDGSGRLLGILVAVVDPDKLGEVLTVARTGQAAIGVSDSTGRLVYRYPEVTWTPATRDNFMDEPALPRARALGESVSTSLKGIDGQIRWGGFVRVEHTNWVAAATRPEVEANSRIAGEIFRDALAFLLIALLGAVTAVVVGRRITVPIKRLEDQAAAIGMGRFDEHIVVAEPVELSNLARAMSRMGDDLKARQQSLEQALAEQSVIFASLADPVLVFDASGKPVRTNPAIAAVYGIDPVSAGIDEFVRKTAVRHPDGRPLVASELPGSRALRDGKTVTDLLVTTDSRGRERVVQVSASPLVVGGAVVGAAGVWHDITEREQLLGRVLRHAAELRAIVEGTQAQIALLDRAFDFVMVNSAYEAGSGYRRDDLIGRNHFELFPNAENQAIFERVRDTGEPYEALEKPFQHPARPDLGTTYWNWVLVPVRDKTGRVGEVLLSLLDVTAQVKARQQMRNLKEDAECRAAELDAAIVSIPDAVLIFSPAGTVERMNEAARALLGYSSREAKASTEERLVWVHAETPDGKPFPPERAPTRRALGGETVHGVDMVIRGPEGRKVWTSCSAAPIRATDDQMLGAVVIMRDITAARMIEAERERLLVAERLARGQAESAVKARDDFISIAAHELKTPVTSLRGFAELLVRQFERTGTVDYERLTKAMAQMSLQSVRLTRLTEQLLNLTQLDAGKLAISPANTDLHDLVERTVESVRLVYPDRKVVFEGETAPAVWVDGLRLEQVIRNLLENALKYSPADSPVEIELGWEDASTVRISVRDHGNGVPEAQREQVFERFYQGHGERNIGGLGLGLYISRQIVDLHGGQIACEAAEGGGSRFVLRLPANRPGSTRGAVDR